MNKRIEVPLGMVTRKFYCHRCGEELEKVKTTRMIDRDDPIFWKKTGSTVFSGDLELTEYDFHCAGCDRTVTYDQQCAYEQIQKRTGSHIIPETVASNEIYDAEDTVKRNKYLRRIICAAIGIAIYLLYYFFGQ